MYMYQKKCFTEQCLLNPKNRNEAAKFVKRNNQIIIYIHSAVPTEYRSSVVAAPGVDGVDAMPTPL